MLVFWWARRYGGRHPPLATRISRHRRRGGGRWWRGWMKKYVIACLVCGGLSVTQGVVFIVIYLLLRSYTSSLQFFETIPTYVPALVFIITGLILVCFIKRRNRYAFLIKMAGGCCLVCALLCVVITVTTTVVHMNRLQTLHECVYTPQAKACMCVSAENEESYRFVFSQTANCEVVHGSLYSCLRALFSFSVLGILLCIACSMLLYQLLTHEKKRLYWEQLEVRRRFLYQRHSHHSVCGCYDELYPWPLWDMLDYRLLAAPNTEEEPPSQAPRTGRRASGWNWLPWTRQSADRRAAGAQANSTREQLPEEAPLPWRSECIHIFRPRSANCFPPSRFGIRPRSSPYGRPPVSHRRTRSNDGIFHHLHMNSSPRYAQPYSLVDSSGGCHFSGCEIPRYMWGPPPPYSQPPSTEDIVLYDEVERRRSGMERLRGGHCDPVFAALELEQAGNGSMSSKMSTPLSERRFVCHNFSSEGITLTIGGNYTNMSTVPREKEDTCIVEVHVPYILQKKDVVFNTLPTRSCKRKDPFKSLSNIPLGLARKTRLEKSVIKASCDLQEEKTLAQVADSGGLQSLSAQLFCDEPCVNNVSLEIDPCSTSYQTSRVEVPSEPTLVIATSPSTPVTENLTLTNRVYAQSMPNLTNSTLPRHLRRAPSSGNTSTSQDLEEDDLSPVVLCSPPPLPDDDSSSSSSYPPCIFRCDASSAAFSNDSSDSSSVIVISKRPPAECPLTCTIRHLHHYHSEQSFVVTIKSVDV